MKRYEPKQWESAIGEPYVNMVENVNGEYVSYHDHMLEVTKLQERIAELNASHEHRFYGDV